MTHTPNAGSSTDQNVSGLPETNDFPVDGPPTGETPADGSSNAGINELRSNRAEGEEQDDGLPD